MIEYLYRDDEILIVNKPPKMLSVPGRGPEKQDCLWNRVKRVFPTALIVHRLDYATSGLLVMALNPDSHRELSRQFRERETRKRYQAVISGVLKEDSGEVNLPLRCDWENRPLQIVDHEQGKQALTLWECIGREADRSRVLLTPVTGRSHQLRVHMQQLGHAILGDEFYAQDEARAASPRLLLHGEMLGVQHPVTGEPLDFTAPCPF